MARLLGPDGPTRVATWFSKASRLVTGLAGKNLTVYADEACTQLAGIAAYQPGSPTVPGSLITGSTLKIDADSVIPLFWFPDGADTVWARASSGQVLTLTASVDKRLDALTSAARLNVRAFGAAGDGVADDTAEIQSAINAVPAAGGTVYFPAGQYLITDVITLRSNLVLVGDGDGPSIITQLTGNKDAFTGSALNRVTLEKLYVSGTGSGTGSGLNLTKGANAATPYITIRDVTFDSFGRDGVQVENAIVSSFDRVICTLNGRYGVNLYGQTAGAAGTSCSLKSVYANANGTAGHRIYNMVYTSMSGCAADNNPIGYLIDASQAVTLTGCGAEGNTTNGFKVNGGYGITLAGAWVFNNKGVGVLVTGTAHAVSVIAAIDNTPNGTATNFIKVDTGSQAALLNCNNTTANSLASGTTNVVSDSTGGAQMQGYTALLGGGEFDSDLICYVAAKGIVLSDRSNGNRYRIKVTAGVLGVEVAP